MSRRVWGPLAALGVVLVSWGALSQSGPSGGGARPMPPRELLASALRVGIAPAPRGTSGHFVLQHLTASAAFSERGMELRLASRDPRGLSLGWRMVGAREVVPRAEKPRDATLNRFVGAPDTWERGVPTYGGVRYPGVLPGVDLWFEDRPEGVEYGFRAERGEALRRTELEYTGVTGVRVVEQGRALEVDLEGRVLREQGLRCEQETAAGARYEVDCRFADARRVDAGRWRYAIEVEVEDPALPVVVDPLIVWGTYTSASATGFGDLVRKESNGVLYVTGTVPSGLIPGEVMDQSLQGGTSVLLGRFPQDGSAAKLTVFGGARDDVGQALALTGEHVYVAGSTQSPKFKNDPPSNHAVQGEQDGFVAQFDANTLAINWIHLIDANSGVEEIHDLAVGLKNTLIAVGSTASQLADGSLRLRDALIVRIDPNPANDGSVEGWRTVLSGASDDVALGVAASANGDIFVTGMAGSASAVAPAVQLHSEPEGIPDAFVVKLEPDHGGVRLGTFLGGKGSDEGRAIAFFGEGGDQLVVVGTTRSQNFPKRNAAESGNARAFVLPIQSNLELGLQPWLLGDKKDSEGRAVLAMGGVAYVGGVTRDPDFPLVDAFDREFKGEEEGFVSRVDFTGSVPALTWSSFVGGDANDAVLGLQGTTAGRLYVGGVTSSSGLVPPGVPGPHPNLEGNSDIFLLEVGMTRSTPDAGTPPDAGGEPDGGPDAGGEPDGGSDAGMGNDGGGDAPDGGVPSGRPLLGYACGASGANGGAATFWLVGWVGLAMGAVRRRTVGSMRGADRGLADGAEDRHRPLPARM